ncbi:hypothetical protein [Streptomyces sp. NPDC047071]|uniref:hypothetical protein n=1 Tax=Streptomyces sp. NPDC047071 TaxID=3154808 RepID=UPI003452CC0E
MGDGMVRVDEELEVVVYATTSWGVKVATRDGVEGFIDNLKIPSWLARGEVPGSGTSLLVVVLDDARKPFRGSLLDEDIELARNARRQT